MEAADIVQLKLFCKNIRKTIIEMLDIARSGHPGGSLSAVEIMVSLFYHHLNIDPKNPTWPQRDRFILSKGHAAPALYAILAKKGFFPEEKLKTLRQIDSMLQGHPDMNKTPGVDFSAGSLGHGLSAAIGMAWTAKLEKSSRLVYVLMGDGEMDEGQVWEALMAARHRNLDNIIGIIDRNHVQLDGATEEVMDTGDLAEKVRSFGWYVEEVDGHDVAAVIEVIEKLKQHTGDPKMLVARTIKGKGVSFMENKYQWHGNPLTDEYTKKALNELAAEEIE
jgi:transketolase